MLNAYSFRRVGLEGSGTPSLHLSVHFCRGQWQVATLTQGGADIKAADGTACSASTRITGVEVMIKNA